MEDQDVIVLVRISTHTLQELPNRIPPTNVKGLDDRVLDDEVLDDVILDDVILDDEVVDLTNSDNEVIASAPSQGADKRRHFAHVVPLDKLGMA